ncbi:prepilin-type N-terminal cleavage/methylation domain-containing protein [Patescibacteria group bacterium]|nr:prepilin-type N-terminal cleavage/methylation domain-containing protein [Patescibacteria group bacterium]
MKIDSKKGFTLIELLVVIAIIGILAAVIIASLNTARGKSRDAKRLADMKQLQIALELYKNDYGSYPSSSGWRGNCATYGGYPTTGATGYIPGLAPTYISVLPLDPKPISNTGCYLYQSNSTGTDYMLLVHATVEGIVPTSVMRPIWIGQPNGANSYAFYTAGAAGL